MENNLVKHNTQIIQDVLKENLHGEKDSDISCVISVLQRKGVNPDQITLSQYLQKMASGDVPWIESITRIRRMMQKLDPALYGKTERVRKGYRVKKVKQELNQITDEITGQTSFIIK